MRQFAPPVPHLIAPFSICLTPHPTQFVAEFDIAEFGSAWHYPCKTLRDGIRLLQKTLET
jgi:hypothetical protein